MNLTEAVDYLKKRLTQNKRDSIWGLILFVIFFWFTVSFFYVSDPSYYIGPYWTVPPIIISNIIFGVISVMGMVFALICAKDALFKREE